MKKSKNSTPKLSMKARFFSTAYAIIRGIGGDDYRAPSQIQVNYVQHTPAQTSQPSQAAPPEMPIEQKVARFNEIFATAPANRTEEETWLMKKLAPEVSEYQKQKIMGRLGRTTDRTAKNTIAPANKAPSVRAPAGNASTKENESIKLLSFLDGMDEDELLVTIVERLEDMKKYLIIYDEDCGAIGCEPLDTSVETDEVEDVDVVELNDDNGDSIVLEVLGNAYLNGARYFILTHYLEGEPAEGVAAQSIILKQIQVSGESMLEPLADEALNARIYSAFKRAAGDSYDFV